MFATKGGDVVFNPNFRWYLIQLVHVNRYPKASTPSSKRRKICNKKDWNTYRITYKNPRGKCVVVAGPLRGGWDRCAEATLTVPSVRNDSGLLAGFMHSGCHRQLLLKEERSSVLPVYIYQSTHHCKSFRSFHHANNSICKRLSHFPVYGSFSKNS